MLYILVPVFNRKEITSQFCKQLKEQSFQDFKLVLIDDGSTDGTSEAAKEILNEKIIILTGRDMWWGGSLELGYQWLIKNASDTDIVCINNDDVKINKNYLKNCIEEFNSLKKGSFLFTPSYSIQTGKLSEEGVHYNHKNFSFSNVKDPALVNCLSTRGLFFYIDDMKKVGGFIPEKIPHYLSDYEYTIRAGMKGFNLVVSKVEKLEVDESTTGIHDLYSLNIYQFFKFYLSNRYSNNPIYMARFAILTNDNLYYKIITPIKVYYRSAKQVLKYFLVKSGILKI